VQQRLISAAVLVPVVVIVFLLGDPWLSIGIAVLAAAAAWEAARLMRAAGLASDTWFVVAVAVLLVAATRLLLGVGDGFGAVEAQMPSRPIIGAAAVSTVMAVVVLAGIVALRYKDPRQGFLAWAGNVLGSLYPGLLGALVGILFIAPAIPEGAPLGGRLDAGRIWLLILVLTVWSFDTFAYLSGRTFKRGHFMNHISPNKTWSGVIGGTIAALLVGSVLAWAAGQLATTGFILGFLIAVTAQAGDLAESVIKRAAGAKDSSNLIPGHGGVLDRVDSFLFAGPAMLLALAWGQWLLR
jgi:phosphatidate cytidylyltransferase